MVHEKSIKKSGMMDVLTAVYADTEINRDTMNNMTKLFNSEILSVEKNENDVEISME